MENHLQPLQTTVRPAYFYSEAFQGYDMGGRHPLKPVRLKMTHELLDAYGAFGPGGWLSAREPRAAAPEEAAKVHAEDYLDAIESLNDGAWRQSAARYGFGSGDNPVFPGIWDASLLYSGASVMAAEHVLATKGRAVNISGGLHHAHYDRAAGFCVLNDLGIAIARLRQTVGRVAYVDIDAHHGDGVQEMFYDDPSVLTISMHETGRTLFPGTGYAEDTGERAGLGYSLNVPLRAGTDDDTFLWAFDAVVPRAIAAFRPDVIVTQLGCDAHFADPLAHLSITTSAYETMYARFAAMGLPWLATGGGGYNLHTVPRAWALACAAMAGVDLHNALPAAWAARYGLNTLRDAAPPALAPAETRAARAFAEDTVKTLERLAFPILEGGRP